jgi:hypothetical protein
MFRIFVICLLIFVFWKFLVLLGIISLVGAGVVFLFLLDNIQFLIVWGMATYLIYDNFLKDVMHNPSSQTLDYLSKNLNYWTSLSLVVIPIALGIFILTTNFLSNLFQSLLTALTLFVIGIAFLAAAYVKSALITVLWILLSIFGIVFLGILSDKDLGLAVVVGFLGYVGSIFLADYFYSKNALSKSHLELDELSQNQHRLNQIQEVKSESGMYCYHCGKKMGIDSLKYAEKRYCSVCEKLDLPKVVEKVAEAVQPTVNKLDSSKTKKSININLIIGIFVSITLVLILFQLSSGSKNDAKLTKSVTSSASYQQTKIYDYDKRIELTGTLVSQRNNDIEKPFNFIAIRLDQPISFKANSENEAESNIFILQLAYDDVVRAKATKNLNKKIKLIGTPFHSFSAHHATKVLISVDSINE